MASPESQVAVIGGGAVGCAVAHALARCDVETVVIEAEAALALGASGANSGILHTGFDSVPGELETQLILRAAELRAELLDELGVPVERCGARLVPRGEEQARTVAALAANAAANGVEAKLLEDGALTVPGESVTDPVAFVTALAAAARAGGAQLRLGAPVTALARDGDSVRLLLGDGSTVTAAAAVNCAGLFADEVARMAGDELVEVYPRKGEFLVFAQPPGSPLREILLPVPSAMGKGVLVFPTLDGRHLIAGPTARERSDKRDWSVEDDAAELLLARATEMFPPLVRAERRGAYAGLRPAGRGGANYVIERSQAIERLVHVAAIRSTGLSASLAIGEHVTKLLAAAGLIDPSPPRPLHANSTTSGGEERWWERGARLRAPVGAGATAGTATAAASEGGAGHP